MQFLSSSVTQKPSKALRIWQVSLKSRSVMHGGSGVSDEDYHKSISLGIRKVNYYSYMAKAGVDGIKALLAEKDVKYFHELAVAARDAMADDVGKALELFANR